MNSIRHEQYKKELVGSERRVGGAGFFFFYARCHKIKFIAQMYEALSVKKKNC